MVSRVTASIVENTTIISLLAAGHPSRPDATLGSFSSRLYHGAIHMRFLSTGSLDAYYEALSLY